MRSSQTDSASLNGCVSERPSNIAKQPKSSLVSFLASRMRPIAPNTVSTALRARSAVASRSVNGGTHLRGYRWG